MEFCFDSNKSGITIKDNKVHLCGSCQQEFADCDSSYGEFLFGDGEGNDNVCICTMYKPLKAHEWAERRRE